MHWFTVLTITLALVAAAVVALPLWRGRTGRDRHPLAAMLAVAAIPVAATATYLAVSNYDWLAPPARTEAAGPAMAAAVANLEARLAQNPDDLPGWLLLGSSLVAMGRPDEALPAFNRALSLAGDNSDALLGRAEAEILVDRDAVLGRAGDDVERVLAAEPRNPKALWYGGLVALARDDLPGTRSRWGTLLELDPPPRIRQIIEEQLTSLGSPPGLASSTAGADAGQPGAGAAVPTLQVRVTVSDTVRDQVSATAPVFVFVRDAASPGPPLAVVRRQASELPLNLRISDADLMIPGRSLGNLATAELVARIANGGDPIAQPGDVFGQAAWDRSAGPGPVDILIDRVVAR